MLYKPFQDLKLSTLGMGNMRLPTVGERGPIDQEKAREIIERAYHQGVNYFDTAYRYHGGESEGFVGKVLSQFPRDTWYLASKMPGHMMNYKDGKLGFQGYLAGEEVRGISAIFEEQLEKCGVDYFDFYLLHNVAETSYDFYTNEELGVVRYLLEQKAAGKICHLGFSTHGRADTIRNFLDKFPDTFEFVQIQLNYLDWDLQDAKSKYQLLEDRGIPVIVMEPVRGGSLANLRPDCQEMLKAARPDDSIASWAFRFLQSLPGVQVVLSGMTTMEQMNENLELFSKNDPVTEKDKALLQKVVAAMADLIPCTACRYCCEACPQGLDIPKLISMHNELNYSKRLGTLNFTLNAMGENEMPSACLGCGACQQLCPQNIAIPDVLSKFNKALQDAKANG